MTPWVKRLVGANVAMFLLVALYPPLFRQLMLVPALMPVRPWTIISYMFLHAGLWHLAFNMLALYVCGPRLEARLGSVSFLRLYLISGLVAALLSLFTPYAAIVGASGAVFGVLLAFARYWPHERFLLFFVIPMEARLIVILLAAGSLLFGFAPLLGFGQPGGGIAHFAHLGGFLGGLAYLKYIERFSAAARFKAKMAPVRKRLSGADLERWKGIQREGMHPLNREELERILAKAQDQGASSLTDDEKRFLERLMPR